jgi:hypothetical protein
VGDIIYSGVLKENSDFIFMCWGHIRSSRTYQSWWWRCYTASKCHGMANYPLHSITFQKTSTLKDTVTVASKESKKLLKQGWKLSHRYICDFTKVNSECLSRLSFLCPWNMYHCSKNKCNVLWSIILCKYLSFRDIKMLIARWTLTNTLLNDTLVFPNSEQLKQMNAECQQQWHGTAL